MKIHHVPPALMLVAATACATSRPAPNAQPSQQELTSLAGEVTRGVGQVTSVSPPGAQGTVVVVEEQHASIAGQLEIAVMLLRLHQRGWRLVGLEGAPAGRAVDGSWFHPASRPGAEDAVLQLLGDGEISAAELMALLLSDARITGIETPSLYAVDLNVRGWPEATYLLRLAESSLAPAEAARLTELASAGKAREVSAALRAADPWVRARWAEMQRTDLDIEDVSARLHQVRARAEARGVTVDGELRRAFEKTLAFFETAAQRSEAMATNLASALGESGAGRAVMIVGAAHDRGVRASLARAGVGFAVVRPSSFASTRNRLSDEAFDRKSRGRWAGHRDRALGCALNAARKPPPVITQATARSHLWAYEIVRSFSQAHRDGKNLERLWVALAPSENGRLESIRPEGEDLVLKLSLKDTAGQDRTVWARARAGRRIDPREQAGASREQKLLGLIAALREDHPRNPPFDQSHVARIAPDVRAVFGTDETEVASFSPPAGVTGCGAAS